MLSFLVRANKSICRWLIDKGLAREEQDVVAELRREVEQAIADQDLAQLKILEVGGTVRPFLPLDDKYEYHGLDIDSSPETNQKYDHFRLQSVTEPIDDSYNVLFSKYLLEHVRDNRASMKAMADCLAPGGQMIHLIPCGNHPYSAITRMIGNKLQRLLIRKLRPESVGITGYPAFYDCCTPGGICRQMEANGLVVESVHKYWGASEYFTFFVPAFLGIKTFNWCMKRMGADWFASVVVVRCRKPNSATSSTSTEPTPAGQARLTSKAA